MFYNIVKFPLSFRTFYFKQKINVYKLALQKRRPPSFFSNLHECLKVMIRSFRQDNKEVYTSETLKRVEYLLKLHGMETRELIHEYHLERWQDQQSITDPKMGVLTVRAQFLNDNLKVEIMNARNLMPTDSNGNCMMFIISDVYVSVGYSL